MGNPQRTVFEPEFTPVEIAEVCLSRFAVLVRSFVRPCTFLHHAQCLHIRLHSFFRSAHVAVSAFADVISLVLAVVWVIACRTSVARTSNRCNRSETVPGSGFCLRPKSQKFLPSCRQGKTSSRSLMNTAARPLASVRPSDFLGGLGLKSLRGFRGLWDHGQDQRK